MRLVNGSWYLPGQSKFDATCQHAYHRLTKNTQHFDISKCVDPDSDLPITMPSAEIFSEHMQALGIGRHDQIICYDHLGMFSVARVHFMLRYFGATNVRIMNGGFTKWLKEERPFYSGPYTAGQGLPTDGDYSYEVLDSSKLTSDISKIHSIAGQLHNGSKDW